MANLISDQAKFVLDKYPIWQYLVQQSTSLPSLPLDYCAFAIEIFDQHGLLCGQRGELVYESQRYIHQPSDFIAWILDGQLVFFYVETEIIVNRLNLIAASFAILSNLQAEQG
ncbi:MAG TPA: hypothetical protein V6D15_00350 [Oculatellaceae cyanobacterium]|jgi:hypothetical protein